MPPIHYYPVPTQVPIPKTPPVQYFPVATRVLFEAEQVIDVEGIYPWKMNMMAASRDGSKLFIAVGHDILMYELSFGRPPRREPARVLTAGEESVPSPINSLRIISLDREEVLIAVDDAGQVCLYFVNDINRAPVIAGNGNASTWGSAGIVKRNKKGYQILVAVSANNHRITILDLIGGELPMQPDDEWKILKGHTNNIPNIDFSSDGLYMASASIDGTCRLWGVMDGNNFKWRRVSAQWGWWVRFVDIGNVKVMEKSHSVWRDDGETPSSPPQFSGVSSNANANANANLHSGGIPPPRYLAELTERAMLGPCGSLEEMVLIYTTVRDLLVLDCRLNTLACIHNVIDHARKKFFGIDREFSHQFDRLCMMHWIPELSLIVAGSQAGDIALVRLVRMESGKRYVLMVEDIFPKGERNSVPYYGVTVAKYEVGAEAVFHLYALRYDSSLDCYEIRADDRTASLSPSSFSV